MSQSEQTQYRNERDALKARADNLEQELRETWAELQARRGDNRDARVAQLEEQVARAQDLLQELERELRGRSRRRRALTALGLVVWTIAVTAAAWFVLRRVLPPLPCQEPVITQVGWG